MSIASFVIGALKFTLALLLTVSLCLIVVALTTNHWVHLDESVSRGNKEVEVKIFHEYGLFKWCYTENNVFIDCIDADNVNGPLKDIGRADIKVWFILGACVQFISVFPLFFVIIESRRLLYTLIFSSVIGSAFFFNLIGISLFVDRLARVSSYNLKWSFVLAVLNLIGCLLQIPLPCFIYLRSIRKTGDTNYLRKKFSFKDKHETSFSMASKVVAQEMKEETQDNQVYNNNGNIGYGNHGNKSKYAMMNDDMISQGMASSFSTLNRSNAGFEMDGLQSGRSSALGITKDLFMMNEVSLQESNESESIPIEITTITKKERKKAVTEKIAPVENEKQN